MKYQVHLWTAIVAALAVMFVAAGNGPLMVASMITAFLVVCAMLYATLNLNRAQNP